MLPFGRSVGGAVVSTSLGAWALGSGTVMIAGGGAALLLLALRRRAVSWWWFLQLAVVAAGYAVALSWLHMYRLERIHFPEYGIAAWLSWRAVAPVLHTDSGRYTAAAAVASIIGIGEEVLQMFVPGRVFDPKDVVANVVAVMLGLALLPVVRTALSAESRA
jgi:VanZ like family